MVEGHVRLHRALRGSISCDQVTRKGFRPEEKPSLQPMLSETSVTLPGWVSTSQEYVAVGIKCTQSMGRSVGDQHLHFPKTRLSSSPQQPKSVLRTPLVTPRSLSCRYLHQQEQPSFPDPRIVGPVTLPYYLASGDSQLLLTRRRC